MKFDGQSKRAFGYLAGSMKLGNAADQWPVEKGGFLENTLPASPANRDFFPLAPSDTGLSYTARLQTHDGLIALKDLSVGQEILTDRGMRKVVNISAARETVSMIWLRAPFFGLDQDIAVGAQQLIRITSDLGEYMFGHRDLFVPAWAFRDARKAQFADPTFRKSRLSHVQTAGSSCVVLGACVMAAEGSSSMRVLSDFEARAFAAEFDGTGYF